MPDVHRASLVLALLAGIATTSAACSKQQRAPSKPFGWAKDEPTSAPLAPTTPPPPASTCGEGCSNRGMTVLPPQPNPDAMRVFLQSLGAPGLAFGQAADPPKVTVAALQNTALGAAFGMKPAGEMQIAELREGERGSRPVTIGKEECAAFVAQGGLGSIEVDMYLIQAGSASMRILAQDTEPGPMASIGRGECLRGPLSAELHVQMRRGSGIVLIQRFQR